jgi:LPS O-antigen subunit length determinant protein (WzzB/FepE family)
MVIVATLFGGVIAVFFVLARHFAESRTARDVDVEETTAE